MPAASDRVLSARREPTLADVSWNRLLRAPVRPKNLRRLFTKPLKTGA